MKCQIGLFRSSSALLLGAVLGLPVARIAQAAPAEDSPDVAQLEEVVVTAEKRPATLQHTAVSMAVVSGEELKARGATDLQELSVISPDLNVADSTGRQIVTIRGISSRDTSEIGDPAVAVSIDGFYIQRPVGLNAALYDLDQVEILRGPQGTLYGRNATGGAINIITAKPTDQLAGSFSLGYGNYNAFQTQGMMNVPINDRIQIRAAFYSNSHDGYRNNSPVPQRGDDDDTKSGRLEALFALTDSLTALITTEFTKVDGVGTVIDGIPLAYDANDNVIDKRPHFANNGSSWGLNTQGYTHTEVKSLRWKFDYDLGFATATYLGGFERTQFDHLYDLDGGLLKTWAFDNHERADTQNHELRLASKGQGAFQWQLGAYYFNEDQTINSHFYDIPGPTIALFTYNYPDVNAKSYAGFGQVSYKLTDTVEISAGARYSSDRKSRVGTQDNASLGDYLTNGSLVYTLSNEDGSAKSDKTTWHGGINWQVTPENMLYAKVDTGYKAGGFSTVSEYAPETVTAYEIGAKNRWLDNRLQVNVAAFDENYSNQQIDIFVASLGGDLIQNAGKSRIYGLETDAQLQLTPDDRLDLAVNYLHARFLSFMAFNGNVNVDVAGNRMIQAPDFSVGFGYSHDWHLPIGVLTADVHSAYKSAQYFSIFNTQDTRQGEYTSTDLTAKFRPSGSRWTIAGYVRNLENNTILTNATEQDFFGTYSYELAAPRTFGVNITAAF
jgi:iron complex outermembrane recepter protein